jgi:hypothetical protein
MILPSRQHSQLATFNFQPATVTAALITACLSPDHKLAITPHQLQITRHKPSKTPPNSTDLIPMGGITFSCPDSMRRVNDLHFHASPGCAMLR